MTPQLSATSIQLLLTAERLFAREGIAAVSTRRIAQEANQRNVSALQYHFGSIDNLIDALLSMRLETINRRRQELLDELRERQRDTELHGLLEALVLPLVEQLDVPDSHFVGCLYQLYVRARGEQIYSTLEPQFTTGLETVTAAIERCLIELPLKVRIARLRLMASQLIHSVGDWYYQRERGDAIAPVAELAETLVDFIAGGLTAPVSAPLRSKKRAPRDARR
jgi:AcrR family transcriptional regulator